MIDPKLPIFAVMLAMMAGGSAYGFLKADFKNVLTQFSMMWEFVQVLRSDVNELNSEFQHEKGLREGIHGVQRTVLIPIDHDN